MPNLLSPPIAPTPALAVVPFIAYLLALAVLPIIAATFWDNTRHKLAVALSFSAPVLAYLLLGRSDGAAVIVDSARDYVSFMALLTALFVIAGGVCVRGAPRATPLVNLAFLGAGAIAASLVGTTGASALLVRPFLRANQGRPSAARVIVFFIFVVSNVAGLLTPLGDPPLFLGFLRGVPFTWTLRLWAPWALCVGTLLFASFLLDVRAFRREPPRPAEHAAVAAEPITIHGRINLLWLAGVSAVVVLSGTALPRFIPDDHGRAWVQVIALVTLTVLSIVTTSAEARAGNRFHWAPLQEVATVFAGIFLVMAPALAFLRERGASLGVTKPWHFFWASGLLSSVLDNAPTYLSFTSLASGVAGTDGTNLGALASHPDGARLLAAISCGSVMMGALTYIGNGPNIMVKAIANEHGVRMPGFLGYLRWSVAVLVPLFALVSFLFF